MYSNDNFVGVFNITFFNPQKEISPTVSLTASTIVLGVFAGRYFRTRNVEYIKIGYDKTFDIIVIAPCDEKDECKIPLPPAKIGEKGRHSERTYIKAGPAFKALKLNMKKVLDGKRSFSFPAFWHNEANFMIIDLNPTETVKPWLKQSEA
jgi:hypothetical protein